MLPHEANSDGPLDEICAGTERQQRREHCRGLELIHAALLEPQAFSRVFNVSRESSTGALRNQSVLAFVVRSLTQCTQDR